MKSRGKSDYIIRSYDKKLSHLARNCNIENPDEVKRFIPSKETSTATKRLLYVAYDCFCKYHKIGWTKPYHSAEKIGKDSSKR